MNIFLYILGVLYTIALAWAALVTLIGVTLLFGRLLELFTDANHRSARATACAFFLVGVALIVHAVLGVPYPYEK